MARHLHLSGRSPGRLHLLEYGLRWPPETFVGSKLERLAARGVRITVASSSRPARSAVPRDIELLAMTGPGANGLLGCVIALLGRRPARALELFRAAGLPTGSGQAIGRRETVARLLAYARLERQQADVIHFEWGSAAVNYSSLVDALARPMVVSCHGEPSFYLITPSTRSVAQAVPAAFERASAVHCVAEAVRRDAVSLGLDPAKAWLIRGAVDPEFFRPPAEPRTTRERFSILSIGNLRWLKGHEYALLAIAQLHADGIPATLHIIGSDPSPDHGETGQRTRIQYTAEHLGIADHIHLHGQLDPEHVRAHLQRADVLLHTSLSEGLPTVILEAMACALPVVATDVGGTSEAIRDGIEGLLIAPRDPHAAANALTTLWHDPELRQRIGNAGRERAQTQFTLNHQTDQWMTLYRHVAQASA